MARKQSKRSQQLAASLNSYLSAINPESPAVTEMLTNFGRKNALPEATKTDGEYYNAGLESFRSCIAGESTGPISSDSREIKIEKDTAIERAIGMNLASDSSEAIKTLDILASAPGDLLFRETPPYNLRGLRLRKESDSYVLTYLPISG